MAATKSIRRTLLDPERAFVDAIAKGARLGGDPRDVLGNATEIVRGCVRVLELRGRLGALRDLPSLAGLLELEHLDCSKNRLVTLDLRDAPRRLGSIFAYQNRLRALDLEGLHGLETLDVRDNALKELDLTPLARASKIRISGNPLRELHVTDLMLRVHPSLQRAAKKVIVRPATTHELHFACDAHDWEQGTKLVEWAVLQPQCDPATALMIYFRAGPGYYFGLDEPNREEARMTAWLESIEQRFARGAFAGVTVAYDPVKDVGGRLVRGKHVPPAMNLRAEPVAGSPRYPFPSISARRAKRSR